MKTQNIMLDIETLDTASTSVILSIGAVRFSPEEGTIGDGIHMIIDPQSCEDMGLTIGASTVMWWMQQSDEARAIFSANNKMTLHYALNELTLYIKPFPLHNSEPVTPIIWAKSPSFDCNILKNAYKATNMQVPWMYQFERCVRTFSEMAAIRFPAEAYDRAKDDSLVVHNALDDAKRQAQEVIFYHRLMFGEDILSDCSGDPDNCSNNEGYGCDCGTS